MPDLNLDPFLLIPLAIVLVLMAMPVVSRKIWGPVRYTPVHEVYRSMMSDDPVAVIDIRDTKAYRQGTIPGAVNVPPADLDAFLQERGLSETPVALVCQSDLNATRHAARLLKQGRTNVTAMKGGMFAWMRAKYPVKAPA